MKKVTAPIVALAGIMLLLAGCKSKENQAIDLVKKSKYESKADSAKIVAHGADYTCEAFADEIASADAHNHYRWYAKDTLGHFLVCFVDTAQWGRFWEVDLRQGIVKNVYDNEYLSRKYGLNVVDRSGAFSVKIDTEIGPVVRRHPFKDRASSEGDLASLLKDYFRILSNTYGGSSDIQKIYVAVRGNITNNTDKMLTKAILAGRLQLIFEDKTAETDPESCLDRTVSEGHPWMPNETIGFRFGANGLDPIYLKYNPPYAICQLILEGEDPAGYSYHHAIDEIDMKSRWVDDSISRPANGSDKESGRKARRGNRESIENDVPPLLPPPPPDDN